MIGKPSPGRYSESRSTSGHVSCFRNPTCKANFFATTQARLIVDDLRSLLINGADLLRMLS